MRGGRRREMHEGFRAGTGLYRLFWFFVVGSVAGFVLEGLWSLVYWGHWSHHAGVVWGPYCTIYGLGFVAMQTASDLCVRGSQSRLRRALTLFCVCAVAGSLVEYMVSYVQENVFGSVSWDYSDQPLNLNGRVSLMMTVVWGLLGVFFAELVSPGMETLVSGIRGGAGYAVTWALIVFLSVDMLVSAAAVKRWQQRGESIPPQNVVEAALDESFGDERMERLFPNMQFTQIGSYSYAAHGA